MKLEKEKLGDKVTQRKLRRSTLEAEISEVNTEKGNLICHCCSLLLKSQAVVSPVVYFSCPLIDYQVMLSV